jgi:hypothetical protein
MFPVGAVREPPEEGRMAMRPTGSGGTRFSSRPSARRANALRQPARLKAEHNLPYADCFAAALAQARKATLVTSDRDFERVGTGLKTLCV